MKAWLALLLAPTLAALTLSAATTSAASSSNWITLPAYQVRVSFQQSVVWTSDRHWASDCRTFTSTGSGRSDWNITGNWTLSGRAWAPSGSKKLTWEDFENYDISHQPVNDVQSDSGSGSFTDDESACGTQSHSVTADTSGCGTEHRANASPGPGVFSHAGAVNSRIAKTTQWGVALRNPFYYFQVASQYSRWMGFDSFACPYVWSKPKAAGRRAVEPIVAAGYRLEDGYLPKGSTVTAHSQLTTGALFAGKRFMRETDVGTFTMPVYATGPYVPVSSTGIPPKVGTATITSTWKVLYCLKSAGGCGKRRP